MDVARDFPAQKERGITSLLGADRETRIDCKQKTEMTKVSNGARNP